MSLNDPKPSFELEVLLPDEETTVSMGNSGSFVSRNGDVVAMQLQVLVRPDSISSLTTLTVETSPQSVPSKETEEYTKRHLTAVEILEAILSYDKHNVLKKYGYETSHIEQDNYAQYLVKVPSTKRTSEDVERVKGPIKVRVNKGEDDIVAATVSNTVNSVFEMVDGSVEDAMVYGPFFISLDAHLGQRLVRGSIDVIHQDDEDKIRLVEDIINNCRTETVYYALDIINRLLLNPSDQIDKLQSANNFSTNIGQLLEERLDDWDASLTALVDRITPLISGRRNVGRPNKEETAYIVHYVKHIAEFFKLIESTQLPNISNSETDMIEVEDKTWQTV